LAFEAMQCPVSSVLGWVKVIGSINRVGERKRRRGVGGRWWLMMMSMRRCRMGNVVVGGGWCVYPVQWLESGKQRTKRRREGGLRDVGACV
jgi:hypothetical protein